ncbi:MAG: carboxypeptidase-like regulatory domain-containing protein [Mucilaginibacter sp.]
MKKRLLIIIALFFLVSEIAMAQKLSIKGTVTDAISKDAIAGVSIRMKGTSQGTTTDAAGQYTIAAAATDQLIFSYTQPHQLMLSLLDTT